MSNVKICKASSSPSPPPAPSILALVVREKLSKEVSLPAEKSGGQRGVQESWEIHFCSQRDWERESQKEKDRFLILFGIIMIIKTL